MQQRCYCRDLLGRRKTCKLIIKAYDVFDKDAEGYALYYMNRSYEAVPRPLYDVAREACWLFRFYVRIIIRPFEFAVFDWQF